MTNMNFDILKENICKLMHDKNITQQKLGDAIGMSQSNVNKCLQIGNNTRSFTLEQVYKIADYFDRSIDELVGRNHESRPMSPEAICDFFMSLISHYTVVHFEHEVKEKVPGPYLDEYGLPQYEDKVIKYDAFYFPNYITPPAYFDEFRLDDIQAEVLAKGPELHENIKVNQFIQKFIDTFEKFDSGVYDEDDYHILIDAYRKILSK